MSVTFKSLFALLFFFVMTVGCGQKGPLFLPGDPSTIQTDVPRQTQVDQSDESQDDEEEDE